MAKKALRKDLAAADTSHIVNVPEVPEPFEGECPTILVKFPTAQFPEFEFVNWRQGISLGAIERAGQLMVRAVQREQAVMVTKLRTTTSDESE